MAGRHGSKLVNLKYYKVFMWWVAHIFTFSDCWPMTSRCTGHDESRRRRPSLVVSIDRVASLSSVRAPARCPAWIECWRRRPSDGHQQVHGQSQGAVRRQREGEGRSRTHGHVTEHRIRRCVQGSRNVRQVALSCFRHWSCCTLRVALLCCRLF